ncbi:uncharacterized protein LOC6537636 [Drosophila yakuba]|uniref:Uncharacterized protein n=1 Tax=Drosophila yakuba TaxID=7245 RepID=A0A0R1E462_DROYA|nr:uncharacterized protein LOC6537636 [Drosophila yakuba]KRK04022.1 uncharacterized protein Dyak_GE24091 [Drosophila yakuba]
MSSLPTIIGLYIFFFITFSNVHAYSTKCSPMLGVCNMHTDCCSGRCLTYGSYCGYPAQRLTKTYLRPNEFTSIKKEQSKSINDEVKVIGLPNESEPSNDVFSVDSTLIQPYSAAKCHNVGEPCSRAEECCNLRCHTYMHRCVT